MILSKQGCTMSQSIGAICFKVCITLSENKKMREKLRARFEAREDLFLEEKS